MEVEVEGAGRGLDEAPERPAVLTAQRPEPNPGQVRGGDRSDVGLGPGLGLLGREVALGGGVAAAGRALAAAPRTTVPCNNDLLAANFIDDGERVWLIDYEYSGNNDPCFELGSPGVGVVVVGPRQGEAALAHRRPVRRLAGEHVEVAHEAGTRVQPAAGVGGPAQHTGVGEVGVLQRPAGQEADDQHLQVWPVLHDRGPHSRLGRRAGVGVLSVSVDAQQPRVVARAADHEVERRTVVSGDHPHVAVGQPPGQVGGPPGPPRQHGEAVQGDVVGRADAVGRACRDQVSRRTPR
ncbi:MAG: hypothetical protein WKF79_12035 [Nocardioides sp.]